MDTPFTTLNTHLKYMRFESLDPLAQMAMKFAFSEFYEDELENLEGKQSIEHIRIGLPSGGDEAPFRYRRFSGGINLPRGRYYSISNSNGDDSKTLVQELSSYVDPKKSGQILLHDTFLNPKNTESIENSKVGSIKYIIAEFIDSNKPNPFISYLIENGKLSQRENKSIPLPYYVEEVTIPNVIDLRCPKTQNWLYEAVTDCLPGIGYYYSPNYLVPGLVLNGERPQENNLNPLMREHGGSGRIFRYPPNIRWDGIVRDGPKNFFGLLPFLIFPGRGGSPITDAIGRWLQQLGANGLVYPSARNDIYCHMNQNYEITRSSGWNFVDFRDAPEPKKGAWIIIGPDSWWALSEYIDVKLLGDGKSWQLTGSYKAQVDLFMLNQGFRKAGIPSPNEIIALFNNREEN